jgi:putative tryptophan/tyrosine transport system substrate-binding protein
MMLEPISPIVNPCCNCIAVKPQSTPVLNLGAAMRRRDFFKAIGALATAWPLASRARQNDQIRRIGVLMNFPSDDEEGQARLRAFVQALQKLGWTEGGNVRIDTRWAADDADRYRQYSEELVTLTPDVILASASPSVAALQRITLTVPIVFASVIDPIGAGFVSTMARPGGNTTGFTVYEYSISGKWLELLKEIAPDLARVAVLRDPSIAAGIGQFAAIQSAASSLRTELSAIDTRDAEGIERALAVFAQEPNGGVIITGSSSAITHRALIISLMMRYRLPNLYPFRYYPANGGLASYGANSIDAYTRAASYIDRILKGEKPADLPVQAPTKYELVINLKTAKAIGLTIPGTVLARADEIIE